MKIYSKVVSKGNFKNIVEYTLDNEVGLKVSILNLGATITKIETKDKKGQWGNIVLSYKNIDDYIENQSYYGATVGRTSGRIYKGEVEIEGQVYKLNNNYGENQGHGGISGFNKKLYKVESIEYDNDIALEFTYLSLCGEEGYPGNLEIKVVYSVSDDNKLKCEVYGVCDKTTLMNITNHSYFNLSGDYKENILNHKLKMNCDRLLEIGNDGAVTGIITKCNDGDFSFVESKKIGKDINNKNEQLKLGYGYDHPFLFIDEEVGNIELYDENSGRFMKIKTNHKGVVVYTQNFIDEKILIGNKKVKERMGICLEVQSPPIGYDECFKEMSLLEKGEKYYRETEYEFGVK